MDNVSRSFEYKPRFYAALRQKLQDAAAGVRHVDLYSRRAKSVGERFFEFMPVLDLIPVLIEILAVQEV